VSYGAGSARSSAGRARLAALLLGVAFATAAPNARAAPDDVEAPLIVGNVAELDLDRVRELTSAIDPVTRDLTMLSADDDGAQPIGLQDAVEVALLNNVLLQIARLERNAVSHEVPAARAIFHPTTGLAVGASGSDRGGSSDLKSALAIIRQEIPTGATLTLETDYVDSDVVDDDRRRDGGLEVALRQPLMRGGRIYVATRAILDAGYDYDAQDARFESEMLRVMRDAKVAYYESILAARLIDVTAAAVERAQRLIEASEALFTAARASRRDVVSAQIRLSDNLSDLATRQANLRQARLFLRDVLGLPLSDIVKPVEASVPFEPVPFRESDWVERAIRDRPEMRELRARLEQTDLAVRVSSNDVLPRLDALGSYRREDDEDDLTRSYALSAETWRVGLEFEIPFGNVAARERFSAARLRYDRSERELALTRRAIEREVRSQVIELHRSLAEVTSQADKVEQSRDKLAVALARYRQGISDNLDVTDAQQDLLDAETDLLRAIFDYTNGLVRLEASIAGPL